MARRAKRAEQAKQRRIEAEERQTWWASLSAAQQLKSLDKRLGRGKGAGAQRKRIAERERE